MISNIALFVPHKKWLLHSKKNFKSLSFFIVRLIWYIPNSFHCLTKIWVAMRHMLEKWIRLVLFWSKRIFRVKSHLSMLKRKKQKKFCKFTTFSAAEKLKKSFYCNSCKKEKSFHSRFFFICSTTAVQISFILHFFSF